MGLAKGNLSVAASPGAAVVLSGWATRPFPLVLCDKATKNGEIESCCWTARLTDAGLPVADREATNADRLSDLLLRQASALP